MEIGWIGCAIWQANPKWLPGLFFLGNTLFYFFEYETIETHAYTFLTLIILAIGTVSIDNLGSLFFLYHPRKKICAACSLGVKRTWD